MVNEFLEIGIVPKGNRPSQKVVCPNCVKVGKTNIKDTCLSIDLDLGVYNCHKCSWSGSVKKRELKQMTYIRPAKQNFTKLSDKALELFTQRGISQSVVMDNKIVMSKDGQSIIFPYIRNGELINYKQRFIDKKDFRQGKDAEPIMYNYDRCTNQSEIIICEGEFDCLAFEEAGFTNVTSVNQGAPNENDTNVDKKLECITNCYELFENTEKIYIAVDNDANGRRLKDELIRRFGAEKCFLVDFNDCKDANEYLIRNNKFMLSELIKTAKEVPLDGVFTANDERVAMLDSFRNGKKRGQTTHWKDIDKAWTWRTGEVTIWTGYQNEGKSLFLQSLCLLRAFHDNETFAFFSPENIPVSDFFDDLIETFVGKSTDPHYRSNQMGEKEYMDSIDFLSEKFFMIYPPKDFEFETILERAKYLVRRKGIRHLILDPYNTIEHKMKHGEREDLYISRFMSELKRFAIANDIGIHLVAHQLTPQKDATGKYLRPDLNRIKGGGTFSDKADNVNFVWRPNRALDFSDTEVVFGSQKIKKQKLTGTPQDIININFKRKTNRYYIGDKSPFDDIDWILSRVKEPEQQEITFNLKPNTNFDEAPF